MKKIMTCISMIFLLPYGASIDQLITYIILLLVFGMCFHEFLPKQKLLRQVTLNVDIGGEVFTYYNGIITIEDLDRFIDTRNGFTKLQVMSFLSKYYDLSRIVADTGEEGWIVRPKMFNDMTKNIVVCLN